MDPIYLDGSPASVPYDQIEIDDDDEEDQLASDIDEQPQPQITCVPDGEELEPDPDDEDAHDGGQTQVTTVNGKRKHQRKSGERVPGHTLLPVTRLENILRADGMTSYQTVIMLLTYRGVRRRKRSNVERGTVRAVNCNSRSTV
jgi:hypothetical protein